jgi:DNA polymerase-3 subunit alpha
MTPFVHLRSHSQFSFADGLLPAKKDKERPEKYSIAKLAAKHNQSAVALTDLHGMFAAVSFYSDARSNGVKPILGADVWVDPDVTQADQPDAAPVRMVLLSQNTEGYKRLMELISKSNTNNFRDDIPRLKQSWLREGTEGLVALSGDGTSGELVQLFHGDTSDAERQQAQRVVEFYKDVFPGRYFLEVQRYDQPNEAEQVQETLLLSEATGVPLVATHPIQFQAREDYYSHEVRVCIATKQIVDDPTRQTDFTREQYFKSSEEMAELFADLPEALENAGQVALMCSSPLTLNVPQLPRFDAEDGTPEAEYLVRLSQEGLERRLEEDFPDLAERERIRPEYQARLDLELGVINRMGFPGYFLIVADFIGWAKDNNIPIGPGRGSGAGSLVAHSLRITNLDPIQHGLLFERFLNPDRVSMPDFDIDMDIFRRGEIIDYVRQKYGEESVAQIATTGTAAARAAVRNVVRAMGMPFKQGDVLSKLIPEKLGITLANALEDEPKLKDRYESEPVVRKIIDVAMRLEGTAVSVGKHAAGVLIAPTKISDFSPLHQGSEGMVSQYDKDDVEAAGLVKFDFLGLANLSIVQEAQDLINRRPEFQGKPFDIERIPLDDEDVYKLFARGDTVGIFQFESGGMQATLRQALPERFEDLVALNALYRPGPMDLISTYCRRKHGEEEVEYPDPRVEDVLKETYGIMVYQEQVMKVAQVLGGYSLGGADLLRRAMGKKKPEEMAKHREIFKEGAAKNGISEDKALELFELIETFAGYGFNKSHAAAYSLIAYQTGYLKQHYPSEFYVASMNVAARQSKQPEIEKLLGNARARGIQLLPPDVNQGGALFEPAGASSIRYGLTGLKGVGEAPVAAIVRAREEQGKFTSLFDFFRKVGRGTASKGAVENMIRAGAFDSINPNRAAQFASVPAGVKYASDLAKENAEKGSVVDAGLFGDATPVKGKGRAKKPFQAVEPSLEVLPDWSDREKLEQERKAIGFYFSAHPFDVYARQLQGIPGSVPLSRVDEMDPQEKRSVLVAGLIAGVKPITTGNGKRMARITISDGVDVRDVTVFPIAFEAHGELLKPNAFIALEAKVEYDRRGEDQPKQLLMEDAWSFEAFEAYQARSAHLALKKEDLPKLQELVERNASEQCEHALKTVVYIPQEDDTYYKAALNGLRLPSTPNVLRDLKETFGEDYLKIGFSQEIMFRPKQRFNNNNRRRPGR